jgi:membrane-associated phospholipid phosphatase
MTIAMQHIVCGQRDSAAQWINNTWPPAEAPHELALLVAAWDQRAPVPMKTAPPERAVTLVSRRTPVLSPGIDSVPKPPPRSALVRKGDVGFLLGAVAVAGVTSLYDSKIAVAAQKQSLGRLRLGNAAAWGTTVGGNGPIGFSVVVWGAGFVAREHEWKALGREAVEAWMVSGGTVWLTKGLVGRARPYAAIRDQGLYKPGRGFSDNAYASFPSGHTASAFSVATVFADGTGKNKPWIHRTAQILAFGSAASVALSRMYLNDHWASDVIGGAALGVVTATVTMRADQKFFREPSSRGQKSVFDHFSISPGPNNGIVIGYTFR